MTGGGGERDGNKAGLLAYGTSAVGEGLYVGTKLAAKDESSMDNSPVHDQAQLDPQARTLDCHDVGLKQFAGFGWRTAGTHGYSAG